MSNLPDIDQKVGQHNQRDRARQSNHCTKPYPQNRIEVSYEKTLGKSGQSSRYQQRFRQCSRQPHPTGPVCEKERLNIARNDEAIPAIQGPRVGSTILARATMLPPTKALNAT